MNSILLPSPLFFLSTQEIIFCLADQKGHAEEEEEKEEEQGKIRFNPFFSPEKIVAKRSRLR